MKHVYGNPCNEYIHTLKANRDQIVFRFVNNDRTTPAECTVRLGDIDPMTGEIITDVGFFTEYYKLADHQIYKNRKETNNRRSLDCLLEEDENDSYMESRKESRVPSVDPFAEDEPDEIVKLREIAAGLKGRMADVYEALLVQYAGGRETISLSSIARKWGVSVKQVCKDRDRIIRMIREGIAPIHGRY